MVCNGSTAPLLNCCNTPDADEGVRIVAASPFHGHIKSYWDHVLPLQAQIDRLPAVPAYNYCQRHRLVRHRSYYALGTRGGVFNVIQDWEIVERTDFQTAVTRNTTRLIDNDGQSPISRIVQDAPGFLTDFDLIQTATGWTLNWDDTAFGRFGYEEMDFLEPWSSTEFYQHLKELLARVSLDDYPLRFDGTVKDIRVEWLDGGIDHVVYDPFFNGHIGCPDVGDTEWTGFYVRENLNLLLKGKANLGPPVRSLTQSWATGSGPTCAELGGFSVGPLITAVGSGLGAPTAWLEPQCNSATCTQLEPEPPPTGTGKRKNYSFPPLENPDTDHWTTSAQGGQLCP